MATMARFVRVSTTLFCTALLAVGCGGGDARSGEFPVTSEVVSDATTQDIHVFAPQAKGTWPTVLALHGVGGSGQDMGEPRLDWPRAARSCSLRPIAATSPPRRDSTKPLVTSPAATSSPAPPPPNTVAIWPSQSPP